MMNRAEGPVRHKKQKDEGIIPPGLRGVGRDAAWGKPGSDGWVYGHGGFSLTSHRIPVPGCFIHMRNSGNEAKKIWFGTSHYKGIIHYVIMDSKADDSALFRELRRQRRITPITRCRTIMDKSPERQLMIMVMEEPAHKALYKERSHTVEPMQGPVKDISGRIIVG